MFEPEIYFKTSRSSGSGGQNVNKVSTKVELNFDVAQSKLLTEEQRQIIFSKLSNRINKAGILKITVQETRSQFENKEIALKKFRTLITFAFHKPKKRIRTNVSKRTKEKRLQNKKKHSEIKKGRSRIRF
ncbi:MAG: aminoacyl-tRNA hydrolase [Bacteroidetes bacterium]|nr:MAG: aminoacyl-tRNA hydrolase [Bacteroidota bacterium]